MRAGFRLITSPKGNGPVHFFPWSQDFGRNLQAPSPELTRKKGALLNGWRLLVWEGVGYEGAGVGGVLLVKLPGKGVTWTTSASGPGSSHDQCNAKGLGFGSRRWAQKAPGRHWAGSSPLRTTRPSFVKCQLNKWEVSLLLSVACISPIRLPYTNPRLEA